MQKKLFFLGCAIIQLPELIAYMFKLFKNWITRRNVSNSSHERITTSSDNISNIVVLNPDRGSFKNLRLQINSNTNAYLSLAERLDGIEQILSSKQISLSH